jgi:hypothetical protein
VTHIDIRTRTQGNLTDDFQAAAHKQGSVLNFFKVEERAAKPDMAVVRGTTAKMNESTQQDGNVNVCW